MPRISVPPSMPAEVRAVIAVVGSQARTELLHLLTRKSRSAVELAGELGISHVSAHRHLRALEDAGLVRADHPKGSRLGTTVHWSTAPDAVRAAAQIWLDYTTGHQERDD